MKKSKSRIFDYPQGMSDDAKTLFKEANMLINSRQLNKPSWMLILCMSWITYQEDAIFAWKLNMTFEEFKSITGFDDEARSFRFESTEAYVTAMSIANEKEKNLKKSEQAAKRITKSKEVKAVKEKP